MKLNKFYTVLFVGATLVACAPAQENPVGEGSVEEPGVSEITPADFKTSKAQIDSVSYLLGINFGSFVKGYNFGEINYSQVVKAMKDFAAAKGSPDSPEFLEQFKISPELMNQVFNSHLERMSNKLLYENKIKEDKFLAENAKKEGVMTTDSGLQYIIEDAGSDIKPSPVDTVWVNYRGSLLDGTVFDETPEGADPISFTLNRVVAGWTEGLQLIGEGGKIKLFIPSKLGYGTRGSGSVIEPNSTLIFDVTLTKVGKFVEDDE